MTPALPRPARPTRRAVAVAFLGLLAAAGCGPSDDVRSYTVPKPADPKANPSAAPDAPTPDGPVKARLLGAVIPVGDNQSRFIKFSGPVEKIDPHAAAFDELLQSVRVPAGGGPPTYKEPAGARTGPQKQMRLVTYQFGPADGPVELYISDPFGGSLLENVNRWRGEVGLGKVAEADLPTVTTEVQLGDTKAYKMDFRGPGGKGGGMGMTPPFAGR